MHSWCPQCPLGSLGTGQAHSTGGVALPPSQALEIGVLQGSNVPHNPACFLQPQGPSPASPTCYTGARGQGPRGNHGDHGCLGPGSVLSRPYSSPVLAGGGSAFQSCTLAGSGAGEEEAGARHPQPPAQPPPQAPARGVAADSPGEVAVRELKCQLSGAWGPLLG